MTPETLLNDAPQTVIAALLYYKMAKLEGQQDLIMKRLHIEPMETPKTKRRGMSGLFAILAILGMGAGCAMNRPYLLTETLSTNGASLRQVTKATTVALWPASSEVMKQRISSGKTQSIGQEGISAESGSTTNDVQILQNLRAILGR